MRTFHFTMPGKLIFGTGSATQLPDVCRAFSARKILLVTDGGLVKVGLPERIRAILIEAGLTCDIYDGVEPDPRIELVESCAAAAKDADLVIGFGGGSSLDIAKLAAIHAVHGGDVRSYVGIGNTPGRGKPTIMMPTTAGTGSEVTPIAVLSDKQAHLKKGVVSDHLYADVALVDPELTKGLPPYVTAFTGMDTLTHAIEAYTNRFAVPFIDNFALEAIRLAVRSLRRAVCNGDDTQARSDMALASLYGGLCLGSVNTAAVHALAYPLGGTFDVPHGVANSLLLPYVLEFNLISNLEKFTQVAGALGECADGLSLRDGAQLAVNAVKQLAEDIGIVTRMRDLDIPESALDDMAEAAMNVTRLLNNNPRTVTLGDARQIYRNAW